MGDPANALLWSAVSTWELATRVRLGTARIPGPLDQFIPRVLREQALTPLPLHHAHACRMVRLPHDADPFDAALVAQALVEGLPVLSWDARLAALGADLIW
jgi:PIN domain nuclease of toxin-antitoxin system